MLIVMVVSIIFFIFIRVDSPILRVVFRVALVPVIAGVSYEFIRLAGNTDNKLVGILSRPGMWLQGLTTKEPDDSMIEVAIAAVEAVFDWRAYQGREPLDAEQEANADQESQDTWGQEEEAQDAQAGAEPEEIEEVLEAEDEPQEIEEVLEAEDEPQEAEKVQEAGA